jgi:Protein of unknown function (DUF3618)
MTSQLPEKAEGQQAPVVGRVVPSPADGRATDDAQLLREEIERTREHLGTTVEELAARMDVKSRAQAEAAELAGRIKGAGAQIRLAAPGYAKQAAARGTRIGREQRVPLAVAAGVLVVAILVIWQRRRH